jgi:hypothetical protein
MDSPVRFRVQPLPLRIKNDGIYHPAFSQSGKESGKISSDFRQFPWMVFRVLPTARLQRFGECFH